MSRRPLDPVEWEPDVLNAAEALRLAVSRRDSALRSDDRTGRRLRDADLLVTAARRELATAALAERME